MTTTVSVRSSTLVIIDGVKVVPLLKQELLTLPEHMRSLQVFSGVRVTRSLVLYLCFVLLCFFFWSLCCLFFLDVRILIASLVSLVIVLSVLFRYTDSDCPFGIFGHCVLCSSSMYGF